MTAWKPQGPDTAKPRPIAANPGTPFTDYAWPYSCGNLGGNKLLEYNVGFIM